MSPRSTRVPERFAGKLPAPGSQAYVTPLVIEAGGRTQVIAPGAFRATAYDPRTGKEIWWVRYGQGFSNVPRPVFGAGLVFICSGFFEPVLLAVRPDGQGDVTDSHVSLDAERGAPLTPSPLLAEENLYVVSDNGIATCLDARTGAIHWRERLGGNFSASPVYADGRIYFLNEDGETTVIAPGSSFKSWRPISSTDGLWPPSRFPEGRCSSEPTKPLPPRKTVGGTRGRATSSVLDKNVD